MSYITVIPLATAKEYLRVDSGFTSDDTVITRHINAALSFVERATNVLVYDRNVTYNAVDGCVRVYDAPINSFVSPTPESEFTITKKNLYSIYEKGSTTIDVVLNVGYATATDVPEELIEVALEIIEGLYLGNSMKDSVSDWGYEVLTRYKRFLI